MTDTKYQFAKTIKEINTYPVNLHAKSLLKKRGQPGMIEKIHSLELLEFVAEEEQMPAERILGPEIWEKVVDLFEMQTWNPQKAAVLLNLKEFPMNPKPTEDQMIEELIERVNDLITQNQI